MPDALKRNSCGEEPSLKFIVGDDHADLTIRPCSLCPRDQGWSQLRRAGAIGVEDHKDRVALLSAPSGSLNGPLESARLD